MCLLSLVPNLFFGFFFFFLVMLGAVKLINRNWCLYLWSKNCNVEIFLIGTQYRNQIFTFAHAKNVIVVWFHSNVIILYFFKTTVFATNSINFFSFSFNEFLFAFSFNFALFSFTDFARESFIKSLASTKMITRWQNRSWETTKM